VGDIDVARELEALTALPLEERAPALALLIERLERELEETSRVLQRNEHDNKVSPQH
jgi:hypothetical protein